MRIKLALVALAVTATTLAGCGDSTLSADTASPSAAAPAASAGIGVTALSADEILQKSKDALKTAKTFRAAGTTADDSGPLTVDLRVDGASFIGTMTQGPAKMQLLQVGGKKYFRPNEQFWVMTTDAKRGKAMAKSFGDRWISGAENDASFNSLFTIGSVDEMFKPTGAVSKGTEKTIAGVPAISLKDAGDADTLIWIATTGEPYPLRMDGKGGAQLVFSGFGEPVTGITQPPAAQVVSVGQNQK